LHTCIFVLMKNYLFIYLFSPSDHCEDVHKMDKLAAEGRLASHPNQRPHTRPPQYALLFHFPSPSTEPPSPRVGYEATIP
jgi:hypothetical protein